MSEKYVKEILEKLDEIEKLHTKLRSLVPRVKNSENNLNTIKRRSIIMENKEFCEKEMNDNKRNSLKNAVKDSKTKMKKLLDIDTSKYLKKFRDQFSNRFRRFSTNSVDFIAKQWQDKNNKLKSFLSDINDDDFIILVSRASQTVDDDVANVISGNRSAMKLPSRKSQSFDKRRSTLQDISEWFLERLDSSRKRESSVSMHDYGLENIEPHKVRKTSIIPDEETATLNIVSSAKNVSIDRNKKRSSLT